MPRLKFLLSTLLIIGSLYLTVNYIGIEKVLAQLNPDFTQKVQEQYNAFLQFNQNIKTQTSNSGNFLSSLMTINKNDLINLEESYTEIKVDQDTAMAELPSNQVSRSLKLSIIRYESLNQVIYQLLDQIKNAGEVVSESGFATTNIQEEIDNLSANIVKIESYLSTLNYISDQIQQKTVTVEEGVKSASETITQLNIEYNTMFNKVKELISNVEQ